MTLDNVTVIRTFPLRPLFGHFLSEYSFHRHALYRADMTLDNVTVIRTFPLRIQLSSSRPLSGFFVNHLTDVSSDLHITHYCIGGYAIVLSNYTHKLDHHIFIRIHRHHAIDTLNKFRQNHIPSFSNRVANAPTLKIVMFAKY